MAKLQIPLEDELMMKAKLFALQNNTTLKEIVTNALKTYITPTTTSTTNTKQKPKPKAKTSTTTKPSTTIISNTTITSSDDYEYVPMTYIDDVPDFQKVKLNPQDFYGEVPEPYTKGPHDNDPRKYLEDLDPEENTMEKKMAKKESKYPPSIFK